jgi:hypothetical protein
VLGGYWRAINEIVSDMRDDVTNPQAVGDALLIMGGWQAIGLELRTSGQTRNRESSTPAGFTTQDVNRGTTLFIQADIRWRAISRVFDRPLVIQFS